MTNFIGEYQAKVDTKGRVVFPASLKKQIVSEVSDKFVVKKDIFEDCLVLYTEAEWRRQAEILRRKLSSFNRKHSKFLREFYKGTVEITLDSANRLLIPSKLLEIAGIEKDVTFLGQDRKISIWAQDKYDSIEENADDFADLAEELMGDEILGDL